MKRPARDMGSIRHTGSEGVSNPAHVGGDGALVNVDHPAIVASRARWAAMLPEKIYYGQAHLPQSSARKILPWQHAKACSMILEQAYTKRQIADACSVSYDTICYVYKRLTMLRDA